MLTSTLPGSSLPESASRSYPALRSVNSPKSAADSMGEDGKLRVHKEAGARPSGVKWGKGKEKRGHRLLNS